MGRDGTALAVASRTFGGSVMAGEMVEYQTRQITGDKQWVTSGMNTILAVTRLWVNMVYKLATASTMVI